MAPRPGGPMVTPASHSSSTSAAAFGRAFSDVGATAASGGIGGGSIGGGECVGTGIHRWICHRNLNLLC